MWSSTCRVGMVLAEACIVLWLCLTSSPWARAKSICGFVSPQWVIGPDIQRCVMWYVYSKICFRFKVYKTYQLHVKCFKIHAKVWKCREKKTYTQKNFSKRHKVFSNFPFFIKKSLLQAEGSRSIFSVKLSFLVGGKGYFCHSVLNVTKYAKSQKRRGRLEMRNRCFCWHSQNTGKPSSRRMPFTTQVSDTPDLLYPGSLHWAGSLCIQVQAEQIQAASESWCPLTHQVSRLGSKIRIRWRSHQKHYRERKRGLKNLNSFSG